MAESYFMVQGQKLPFPDYNELTGRESGMIKRAFGLRGGELQEAFEVGDTDALLAMILVAMYRLHGEVDVEKLLDVPLKDIEVVTDEEPEEKGKKSPPQPAAEDAADD